MSNISQDSYKRYVTNITRYVLLMFFTTAVIFTFLFEKKLAAGEIIPHKDVYTTSRITSYTENVYAPCMYIYDDEMKAGEVSVVSDNETGSREVTVMSVYYRGIEVRKSIIDEQIVKHAQPKIVHIGTKEAPQYIEPVSDYFITSSFGPRWGKNHNGVDMAVCIGTEVSATADGVVSRASWYNGYGLCVDIEHANGVKSRYAHLSELLVEPGQEVKQGECIALSGSTGYSTGPHLHFELMFDGQAKDPTEYMEAED